MKDIDEVATALILAIGAGCVEGVRWLTKSLRKRRDSQLKEDIIQGYAAIHKTYEALGTVLHETPANRILLLKSENGGGIPGPVSTCYSSVLVERHDDRLPSVKETWQKVPVDGDYAKILTEMLECGQTIRTTERMKQDSPLRDIYTSQKVHHSQVYHLATIQTTPRGGTVYYLSANFMTPEAEMSARHRVVVDHARRELGLILNKHHHVIDTPEDLEG